MRARSIIALGGILLGLLTTLGCEKPALIDVPPKEELHEFEAPVGGAQYKLISASDTTTFVITPEQMRQYAIAGLYPNGKDSALWINSTGILMLRQLRFRFPHVSGPHLYQIGYAVGLDSGSAFLEMRGDKSSYKYFDSDTGSMAVKIMDPLAHELSAKFQMTMIQDDPVSHDTVTLIGEFNRIEYTSYFDEREGRLTYDDGNPHGAYPFSITQNSFNSLTRELTLGGGFGYYPSGTLGDEIGFSVSITIDNPREGTIAPADSNSYWSFTKTTTPRQGRPGYRSETTLAQPSDSLVITSWNEQERKLTGYLSFHGVGRFEINKVMWHYFK